MVTYMLLYHMRKEVVFETHAWKEFLELSQAVRTEFDKLILFLEERGELKAPEAKRSVIIDLN